MNVPLEIYKDEVYDALEKAFPSKTSTRQFVDMIEEHEHIIVGNFNRDIPADSTVKTIIGIEMEY